MHINQTTNNPMKTREPKANPISPRTITAAISELKKRLQQQYVRAYPGLSHIIPTVLDEEETHAWKLTSFPHLLFSDLVEAHVAQLRLESTEKRHEPNWRRPPAPELLIPAMI